MHSHELEFYYSRTASYFSDMGNQVEKLNRIQDRWGIPYALVEESQLTESARARLLSDLRGVPPQLRGKIVTSRGKMLPLSRSKRLNLKNTPVIVIRDGGRPIAVFPHQLGTAYVDVTTSLQELMELGPQYLMVARGLLEEPLLEMLSDYPDVLEEEMSFVDSKLEISTGEIDLLMKDKQGRPVVIEVETHATDAAVGQVLRLTDGFAQSSALHSTPRKMIVCITYDRNVPHGCKNSGVELYRLAFKRLA